MSNKIAGKKMELVMGFAREAITDEFEPNAEGIYFLTPSDLTKIVDTVVIAPRWRMEKGGDLAETHAHIATYLAIVEADDDGRITRALRYSREPAGGEAMLHGNTSIGIGGHANPMNMHIGPEEARDNAIIDRLYQSVRYSAGMELMEEIGLNSESAVIDQGEIGFMYAPTNEVGKYHLAFMAWLRVPNVEVFSNQERATNIIEPWMAGEEDERFEAWSEILATKLLDVKTVSKETMDAADFLSILYTVQVEEKTAMEEAIGGKEALDELVAAAEKGKTSTPSLTIELDEHNNAKIFSAETGELLFIAGETASKTSSEG